MPSCQFCRAGGTARGGGGICARKRLQTRQQPALRGFRASVRKQLLSCMAAATAWLFQGRGPMGQACAVSLVPAWRESPCRQPQRSTAAFHHPCGTGDPTSVPPIPQGCQGSPGPCSCTAPGPHSTTHCPAQLLRDMAS